jgi:PilZ domain
MGSAENSPVKRQRSATEDRSAVRFPLRLPMRVITDHGALETVTSNISASGVLFELDELLPINACVRFALTMPALTLGSQSDVIVHCVGRVVRSYASPPSCHAAAVIDEYRFTD